MGGGECLSLVCSMWEFGWGVREEGGVCRGCRMVCEFCNSAWLSCVGDCYFYVLCTPWYTILLISSLCYNVI